MFRESKSSRFCSLTFRILPQSTTSQSLKRVLGKFLLLLPSRNGAGLLGWLRAVFIGEFIMAVNLAVARYENGQNLDKTQTPNSSGLIRELVTITGSSASAGDTSNAYTPEGAGHGFTPIGVNGGGFAASVSGKAITLTAIGALGNNTVLAEILLAPTVV